LYKFIKMKLCIWQKVFLHTYSKCVLIKQKFKNSCTSFVKFVTFITLPILLTYIYLKKEPSDSTIIFPIYLTSSLCKYNYTQSLQSTPSYNKLKVFENRRDLKTTTSNFIPSMLYDGYMPSRL
jgi:hypothetical protein